MNDKTDLKKDTQIAKEQTNQSKEKTKKNTSITLLAFIVGFAGCAMGGYALYAQHQKSITFENSLANTLESYNQLKADNDTNKAVLDKLISTEKSSNQMEDGEKSDIQSLMKRTYALDQQIKAIQSDYLLPQSDLYQQMVLIQVNQAKSYLTMASSYLALYFGREQSISLIKAAEASLIDADERAKPALNMVRKAQYAIENSTFLNQYNNNKKAIDQLISLINKLKLKAPETINEDQAVKPSANNDQTWYQYFYNGFSKLSSLIQVSKVTPKKEMLIRSDTRENLVVTLKLLLEQAKWALQRQDVDSFNTSIAQAINEVKLYYKEDSIKNDWLLIAQNIRFETAKDYTAPLNEAIAAISTLEMQIINTNDKNNKS